MARRDRQATSVDSSEDETVSSEKEVELVGNDARGERRGSTSLGSPAICTEERRNSVIDRCFGSFGDDESRRCCCSIDFVVAVISSSALGLTRVA